MRIFGIDPGIAGAIAILDEKKIVPQTDLNPKPLQQNQDTQK